MFADDGFESGFVDTVEDEIIRVDDEIRTDGAHIEAAGGFELEAGLPDDVRLHLPDELIAPAAEVTVFANADDDSFAARRGEVGHLILSGGV